MTSIQRSWQYIITDVASVVVGVGIFWIPYTLYWFTLGSLVHWLSLVCFPPAIYMTAIWMAKLASNNSRMASIVAVTLNIVGILVFLYFASECWIEPELANEPSASGGDAMVWGFTALPILLGFFILDLAWFVSECVRYFRTRTFRFGWTLLLILAMWVGASYYDGIHHGI